MIIPASQYFQFKRHIYMVTFIKLFYIIWKKEQIVELLNRICVHFIDDRDDFVLVNDKLKRFMKILNCLLVPPTFSGLSVSLIIPFLGNDRKLFFEIGFPLDWRNDDFAYWIAFLFIFSEALLSIIALLFSVITWYLVLNCGVKYDILGKQIKKMGVIEEIDATGRQGNNLKIGKNLFYLGDLITTIQFYRRIRQETQQMLSFLSVLFLAELATSGFCICGSIFRIIFSVNENTIGHMINFCILFYSFFEIFMVTYLGNEIKSSSDRLTCCLFESNWIYQTESNKKLFLIFGEILQRANVLVVGKLYPLTLQTFSRILNSAYSMLNILAQYF